MLVVKHDRATSFLACLRTPLLLALSACAHASSSASAPRTPLAASTTAKPAPTCPALPPLAERSSAALIAEYGTQLDAYQLEGGRWLESAPILVNQDFDFATAMALEGMGAGIAAAKRIENNEQHARELAQVTLDPGTLEAIDALRRAGTHAFFILWGDEAAVLRLVVERDAACKEHPKPELSEGPQLPFVGEGSWSVPGVLSEQVRALLGH